MSFQRTVRTITSETCIEEYINLRGATNLNVTVKDENGDLLADSNTILNSGRATSLNY
jgi:hypothetical protein